MRKWIALAAGVAILVMVNYTIYCKEQLLTNGRTVLLQLAPVDPRSLMQGDYMALRFKVANDAFGRGTIRDGLRDGRIVLTLDALGVGSFARIDDGSPLGTDEVRMRYRIRGEQIRFATNAFFFQEGDAHRYADACYGEFRVGENGEAILTGLRGKDRTRLGGQESR